MRMVIELRRGEMPEVVLNNLYKQTQFQTVFGINMVALLAISKWKRTNWLSNVIRRCRPGQVSV